MMSRQLLALMIPAMILNGAQANVPHNPPCTGAPVERFLSAWDRADAKSMAELFLNDADLVIPTGQLFSGADTIRGFYEGVFKSGYAGSTTQATIVQARELSAGICLLDGTWKIVRARPGSSQPDESGLFSALLVYRQGAWKIGALREQSSATKLEITRNAAGR